MALPRFKRSTADDGTETHTLHGWTITGPHEPNHVGNRWTITDPAGQVFGRTLTLNEAKGVVHFYDESENA